MLPNMRIVLNLPYLFERCVKRYSTMFALRKTCRNLYRVIERQRLTNSIDSTTLTVEFINVLAIHPGLKSFGGRISNQDAFMEEDFLLERIREVCVSETQYVDCLKIDLNFEFSHTDDLLNTLIDDRKDALKMFAKKAARLTKEIIRKYPDVTSLCFERIYGMFRNKDRHLCGQLFATFINTLNAEQITKLVFDKADFLLELTHSYPELPWNLPKLKTIQITYEKDNCIPDKNALILKLLSLKLKSINYEFRCKKDDVTFQLFHYCCAPLKLINYLETTNIIVNNLQQTLFCNMYDFTTYCIPPTTYPSYSKKYKSVFKAFFKNYGKEEMISMKTLMQIYHIINLVNRNHALEETFQNTLLSGPESLSSIICLICSNFTADFGKRVADKYPHLKAIGIVGVEDEENEQYFNKFGNLEFLVINRIKTQMVIPESVRVVVQNIYSDKYDNICTFINQDSGLEMNFNIQFHLVDDRKSKRVYARTVADLELYLTMLDFADICLLQYNALNTDCKAY